MKTFIAVLKPITKNEYEKLLKVLNTNYCITMGDWLQLYNVADVVAFIEVVRKMTELYHSDKIDEWKNVLSISGISMTYVMNKSLGKDNKVELYSPEGFCQLCWDKLEDLQHCSCNCVLKYINYCA